MAEKSDTSENKTQHLHILMAPSEVDAIDDWGFKNRIRTRGEAIRRLCQIGMLWDENRLEIQNTHIASMQMAEKVTKELPAIVPKTQEDPELAGFARAVLRLISNVFGAYYNIRMATGIAKNLKSEGELEDILKTVAELKENVPESRTSKPGDEQDD